ncbi:MAG TPA: hypothetical protein VLA61_20005 [Ideonella sp.]|uniref:hypothetical protein n=1 Tax=Ideonella sp. TaxID=1929293 RepID=UPI002BACE767|nr:hypothetical protein [Ideonella sp.]HSI50558.1 hypothetical protein [Ideonella sp.]
MKIIYVIGNFAVNTGVGGHYYSVIATAQAMVKAGHQCHIVCIGNQASPVINDWAAKGGAVTYIRYSPSRFFQVVRDLTGVVRECQGDLINAFDVASALFARLVSHATGVKFFLTVCGGPPPKRYSPLIRNVAVFSKELHTYYSGRGGLHVSIIANRVDEFACAPERVALVERNIQRHGLLILRIARINKFYERSILQTLALAALLRSHGVPAQAVIVGENTDEEVSSRVRHALGTQDYLFSDPGIARNAKEIIDVADWVVGTGRSYMEAASHGKVMLCPSKDFRLPVLINEKTFDDAFSLNFSERVRVAVSEEDNTADILREAGATGDNARLGAFARQTFNEYFDIAALPGRYEQFYRSAIPRKFWDVLDVPLHLFSFLKANARAHMKKRKQLKLSMNQAPT